MDIYTIQQQLEQSLIDLKKVLKTYHETKTVFDNLEELKKPVFGKLSAKHKGSEAFIKRSTEGDEEYETYLNGLNGARGQYNRAWANLEFIRLKIDILRSLNKNLQ